MKHPKYRKVALKAGTHPERYFWSSKRPSSKNENFVCLGQGALLGKKENRELIDHIKAQLKASRRFPWVFHEYGAIAVEELHAENSCIGGKRPGRPKALANPSENDL